MRIFNESNKVGTQLGFKKWHICSASKLVLNVCVQVTKLTE